MSEHRIVREAPTETLPSGQPLLFPVRRGSGSLKYECAACHKTGFKPTRWPDSMHWLRSHTDHVLCSCGAVVTRAGFNRHVAQRTAHPIAARQAKDLATEIGKSAAHLIQTRPETAERVHEALRALLLQIEEA